MAAAKWALGVLVVAGLAGLAIWAIVAQGRWEARCHDAGGRVEERFEGYITTYTQVGNVQVPQITPQYSYHCWVGGREVDV